MTHANPPTPPCPVVQVTDIKRRATAVANTWVALLGRWVGAVWLCSSPSEARYATRDLIVDGVPSDGEWKQVDLQRAVAMLGKPQQLADTCWSIHEAARHLVSAGGKWFAGDCIREGQLPTDEELHEFATQLSDLFGEAMRFPSS